MRLARRLWAELKREQRGDTLPHLQLLKEVGARLRELPLESVGGQHQSAGRVESAMLIIDQAQATLVQDCQHTDELAERRAHPLLTRA
jgi:hypothetical protein